MRCAYDAEATSTDATDAPPIVGADGGDGSIVAPPASGTPTAVAPKTRRAGLGAGVVLLLVLTGVAISALIGYILRRRWLHLTRTAAAHLDSAFDGRITPDDLSPREDSSPWELNEAAAEAARRLKAAIEVEEPICPREHERGMLRVVSEPSSSSRCSSSAAERERMPRAVDELM